LRRELLKPLGNVDLAELDRNKLVQRVSSVEESGRPGAAQDLRSKAAVFLGWAADTGLITASPLAGWRRKRRTRAERLEQAGRAFEDAEIPIFWQAATETEFPFGPYLKLLLLLMQRRTETSLMRWPDLDLKAGEWSVPPEITKSGRTHRVPVPPPAVAILEAMPRLAGTDLVFPGRRGRRPGSPASNGRARLSIRPMSGWSKRLPPVYERTAAAGMKPWTPHDLRRTARTGLGRLGVDRVVSELLLDHAVSDELAKIYDRGDYWHLRVEAAARWAAHVMRLVEDAKSQVVPLRSTG
jgi:integrase